MSKSNTTESDLLLKIFNNTALSWDAIGSIWVALHTADPGETGTAVTSEATYTGYARVAVARTSGGWTVSGTTQVANAAAINFAACTAGSNTITFFSVVTTASGAGQILYSGALTASLAVSAGITPQFAIGALTCTED
jgi:hypothetical protein